MQVIFTTCRTYIVTYYNAFFSKGYFICIALLLGIILFINYRIGFPVFQHPAADFIFDYCLYAIPFAGAYFLQKFFYENNSGFSRKSFWWLLLLAPAFFSLRVNTSLPETIQQSFDIFSKKYVLSSGNYLWRAGLLILLVAIVWRIKDKSVMPLYGISSSGNNRIYLAMLLAMIPLVLLAASRESFGNVYPKSLYEGGLQPGSNCLQLIFFETCYGFDFFSIEFFFRGFLILAFAKYFGMRAIVPAACFYCCIHLGKPAAEAASSFFGGLLLGIISYNTKSIWGGLFIHLGIAWMMEVAAWLIHHS
ncbi:MAG: CPBP family intramembrane metalloprotease [Ferruginibacter sp.]